MTQASGILKSNRRTINLPLTGGLVATTGCGAWTAGGTNEADVGAAGGSNLATIPLLLFDTTSDESAYTTFLMPLDYDGGNIWCEVMWKAAAATSGTVLMDGTLGVIAEGASYDVAGTAATGATAVTTAGTAGLPKTSTFYFASGIASAGELCVMKLWRDVSGDTMAEDAQVLSCVLTYNAGIR